MYQTDFVEDAIHFQIVSLLSKKYSKTAQANFMLLAWIDRAVFCNQVLHLKIRIQKIHMRCFLYNSHNNIQKMRPWTVGSYLR